MQRITLLSIFSVLLLDVAIGEPEDQKPQGRIYGGYQEDIDKAPYMAQVIVFHQKPVPGQAAEAEDCGGSILRTNLILTAAHCVKNYKTGEEYGADRCLVFVGSDVLHSGDMHNVKKVHIHPDYDGPRTHYFHDVAILELPDDITLDQNKQLSPLTKPTDKTKIGDDVFVSGWGKNPDHPNDNRLYQVHLKVMSARTCKNKVGGGDVKDIEKHNLCVGAQKKAHCQGDSGGPLIDASTKRQVGIVSWGTRNCTNSLPRYFTRVTDVLDFIDSVIDGATAKHGTHEDEEDDECEE